MARKKRSQNTDPEILAISEVYTALKGLPPDAQSRVISYVIGKLSIGPAEIDDANKDQEPLVAPLKEQERVIKESDDLEGISPIAKKWMTRNGLQSKELSSIFSLGADEIDLIAKKVPGRNKKDRMHNVALLKGIAAYLSSGSPRFEDDKLKEACLHYDALDAAHFARDIKTFWGEISGSKETGYTLTARGLAAATELVKEMIGRTTENS